MLYLFSPFSSSVFKDNGIVAITNDGPKGPPMVAKTASIMTALKYKAQIMWAV